MGRRIRLPGPAVARTELALRRTETPERMPLIERALASLAATLNELGTTPPPIYGLLVDDDSVEVLLAHPAPPPPPWQAGAEGFRWRIDPAELPNDRPPASAPLPALVSLGRVAAGTADALINLEAAGLLGVTGDAVSAAGLVHGLATHLIGAPWARAVDLVLVGFPPGLAAARIRAHRADRRRDGRPAQGHCGDHVGHDAPTRLRRRVHRSAAGRGRRRLAARRDPVPLDRSGETSCYCWPRWRDQAAGWRRSW